MYRIEVKLEDIFKEIEKAYKFKNEHHLFGMNTTITNAYELMQEYINQNKNN